MWFFFFSVTALFYLKDSKENPSSKREGMTTQRLEGKRVEERVGEGERERKSTRMWERKRERAHARGRERERAHARGRGRERGHTHAGEEESVALQC